MTQFRILATGLLVIAGTAAVADGPQGSGADLVIPESAIVSPWDFTGLSVGALVGYGSLESDAAATDGQAPTVGVRAAFDHQFGRLVIGAGVQYLGVDPQEGIFRAGPRVGVTLGRSMLYGTAGYAEIYTTEERVEDSGGYFLGLGGETFITDRITAGIEVNYDKFEDFDDSIYRDLDATAYSADVSINFRF